MNNSIYSITCTYCNKKFNAKRRGAKYCSGSCRTKAYRRRHDLPFPDFSRLVTTKMPTEKERKLLRLTDELEAFKQQEAEIIKVFEYRNSQLDFALASYKGQPSNWGRENVLRKEKELDEVKNTVRLIHKKQERLGSKLSDVKHGIDREFLENKQLIISADDIIKLKFRTIELRGKWRSLIGRPSHNFHIVIHGPGKSGRTTFALKFANHLKEFGAVVFFAVYEKISLSIQKKLIDNNISGIDLSRAKNLMEIDYVISKGNYDFVFIDNAPHAHIMVDDIDEMRTRYQKTSFITIFQVSEDDNPQLIETFKQRSDVFIRIDKGVAKARGRYNPYGEMEIFD